MDKAEYIFYKFAQTVPVELKQKLKDTANTQLKNRVDKIPEQTLVAQDPEYSGNTIANGTLQNFFSNKTDEQDRFYSWLKEEMVGKVKQKKINSLRDSFPYKAPGSFNQGK